jgi:hypothetical protein
MVYTSTPILLRELIMVSTVVQKVASGVKNGTSTLIVLCAEPIIVSTVAQKVASGVKNGISVHSNILMCWTDHHLCSCPEGCQWRQEWYISPL